jgi:hypothetical protein
MSSNEFPNSLRVSVGKFKYCKTCKVVKSKHLLTQRKEDFTPRDFGQVISIDKEVMPCESL